MQSRKKGPRDVSPRMNMQGIARWVIALVPSARVGRCILQSGPRAVPPAGGWRWSPGRRSRKPSAPALIPRAAAPCVAGTPGRTRAPPAESPTRPPPRQAPRTNRRFATFRRRPHRHRLRYRIGGRPWQLPPRTQGRHWPDWQPASPSTPPPTQHITPTSPPPRSTEISAPAAKASGCSTPHTAASQ